MRRHLGDHELQHALIEQARKTKPLRDRDDLIGRHERAVDPADAKQAFVKRDVPRLRIDHRLIGQEDAPLVPVGKIVIPPQDIRDKGRDEFCKNLSFNPWHAIAVVTAKTAVERKPSGFLELDVLTRVYASTGQVDAARESIVRSARIMPSPSFHSWGSGRDLPESLYEATKTAMVAGLDRTPEFERSSLHLDIGRFAFDHGDLGGALAEMTAAASCSRSLRLRDVPISTSACHAPATCTSVHVLRPGTIWGR